MSVDDLPEWTVAVWWLSMWDDEWWLQEEELAKRNTAETVVGEMQKHYGPTGGWVN